MALSTWTELKASVADWLHRPDLTTQIVDFISMGEAWLARDLRVPQLLALATVSLSGSNKTNGTLPTGWVEGMACNIENGAELQYVTPDVWYRMIANPNGMTVPQVWTEIGTKIYVAPTWATGANLSVLYFAKETVLSGSTASNWYLANVPDLLLYASLLQAAPFINDADQVNKWKEFYQAERDRVNDQYGALHRGARSKALASGQGKATAPSI